MWALRRAVWSGGGRGREDGNKRMTSHTTTTWRGIEKFDIIIIFSFYHES